MNSSPNVDLPAHRAKRNGSAATPRLRGVSASLLGGLLVALPMLAPSPARAVDGCLVLLCFAAPSWSAIPECVPPIREVLRDLARGRPFPSCGMAGAGNSASHAWASAPGYCPPQYTHAIEGEGGLIYSCDYSGAVSVSIDGVHFARTWWAFGGDTVPATSRT